MAFGIRPLRQPLGLTLTFEGARSRTLRLGRCSALVLFGALPLLATWYFGATLYFVFHDQLLASLMAHQMDMQYAYEDKIATLKVQLDREVSRGLVDRRSLDTTLRDLAARGDQLAARAATIDALLSHELRSPVPNAEAASRAPLLSSSLGALPAGLSALDSPNGTQSAPPNDELRLERPDDTDPGSPSRLEKRSDLSPSSESVSVAYDRIEAAQVRIVAGLRAPLEEAVAKLASALAETGLPPSRWQPDQGDIGGPFVPLSAAAESGFEANVAFLRDAMRQEEKLGQIVEHVPLRQPLEGPIDVTSTFGPRLDPFYGRPAMHTGIDLHEEADDAVEATASGIVTIAGPEGGYGNMVEIDHGNGLATRYAHLSAINVAPHQKVLAGAMVGRVGSTGRATGPHLHYETRINGEPVDPTRFLRAGAGLFPY